MRASLFISCLHRRTRGFTLIELLVVIVILGVLMAVAVPTFLAQQQKAQDSRTEQYLTTAFKAIRSGTVDTGDRYPASTSMVSWIRQSEPELTAESGSCMTQVQSAPQDAVLVDPNSSSSSLTLCARSQSGNVYRLTASATGPQTLADGTAVVFSTYSNVITDSTRAANTSGDGLSNDSSTGIWQTTTNLIPNGGFETNALKTTKWSAGTVTISQDASQHKFGQASANVQTDGTAVAQGIVWTGFGQNGLIPVTASTSYTFSLWAKGSAGGEQEQLALSFYDSTPNPITPASTVNVTLTTSWTRYTITATSPSNAVYVWPHLNTNGQAATSYWVDGAQLEQLPIATPYVDTSSATVTRAAGEIQLPAATVSAAQGWWAIRLRMGWANTNPPGGGTDFREVVRWSNASGTTIALQFRESSQKFELDKRQSGQPAGDISSPTIVSFSAGSYVTLIGTWTTGTTGISVDGAAFTTYSYTPYTPPGMDATVNIGWNPYFSGREIDGDVLWFASGTGTLSNTDAVTINGWGNADPTVAAFPAAAQATMVWNGVTGSGSLK